MRGREATATVRNFVPGVWSWLGLFVIAALLFAPPVEASHEVDHRYLVLGYVSDGAGRPISRTQVQVVREKTRFTYHAETDADGFYLIVAHLHDEDLLDTLRVTANGATIRVHAWLDPVDTRNHRGTRVDLTGTKAEERREMFAETLADYLKK